MASFLLKFDSFPKPLEDFRARTTSGAIVTIVTAVIILWLTMSELISYASRQSFTDLHVDDTLSELMPIHFDVLFPNIPCDYLSVDSMDVSGNHQRDVQTSIYKQRLDAAGKLIGNVDTLAVNRPKVKVTSERPADYCGSCYGAEQLPAQCCNTCEEVREAYRAKGWAFGKGDTYEQCVNEGFEENLESVRNEGCRMYGSLHVNKIAGNFHFAPGKSFQQSHMHVHDLQPFPAGVTWNFAHKIHALSFGTVYPGVVNPLDNVDALDKKDSAMHSYFVKIVPTTYIYSSGNELDSYQYSSTYHARDVGHGGGHGGGLPGVFFVYDLSPIRVTHYWARKPFSDLLVALCSIIGGTYAIAALVDAVLFQAQEILKNNGATLGGSRGRPSTPSHSHSLHSSSIQPMAASSISRRGI